MADSETSIANSALIKLGAARILSLTDNVKAAIVINEQFHKVRKRVMRSHPWNFTIVREQLAEVVPVPTSGFGHAYQIPTACLWPLNVTASTDDKDWVDYKIEGRYVLSDESTVYLKYVSDVTDTTLFDSAFDEAFACALAADIAYAITQNANVTAQMQALYKEAIREARGVDAFEDGLENLNDDIWIRERI